MEINIVLLLATLFAVTHQEPTKNFNGWQTYEIYKDSCPLNKELWNPYQKNSDKIANVICLCEGNYKDQSRKRYNHGPFRECPQLKAPSVTTEEANAFLLCWTKQTHSPENLYQIMVPEKYSYPTKVATLFDTKYPNALKQLNSDRRCNFQLSEKLRNEKLQLRGECSYRGHNRGHKKGPR